MKKTLFLLMAAVSAFLMVACEPEEKANKPSVCFTSPVPVLSDGVATVGIAVTNYSGDAVTVPVTFGGTAEKDVDYTVSAEAFVVGGTSPVTEITITPLTYDDSKTVSLTLVAPEGFDLGQYSSVQYNMSGVIGYITFRNNSAIMTSTANIAVDLYDDLGSLKNAEKATFIAVEVDETKSTAKEGVHFEFEGEAGATIDQGKNSGVVSLNLLKQEEGCDALVLNLKPDAQFGEGTYISITIDIAGSAWDKLVGKWTMNEIVTDPQSFIEIWGEYMEFTFDGFPEFNANDTFTIDTDNGKFIPDFQSAFKNYFIGESDMTNAGEYFLRTGMWGEGITLQLLNLDNINRYFTEGDLSEDKEALVGVQIIKDENGNELLDMYIIDYIPHSFLKELDDGWTLDRENKPSAATSGCYLNVTFKRAE